MYQDVALCAGVLRDLLASEDQLDLFGTSLAYFTFALSDANIPPTQTITRTARPAFRGSSSPGPMLTPPAPSDPPRSTAFLCEGL